MSNVFTSPSAALFQAVAGDADRALVDALRRGETRAAEALFAAYAPYLHKVLTRLVGLHSETLELVEDVSAIALASLHQLEDPGSLRPWLVRLAVSRARWRMGGRKRGKAVGPSVQVPQPQRHVEHAAPEGSEALVATYQLLSTLSVADRFAFTLRFLEGMELAEVARACGSSLTSTKRRVTRAEARFSKLADHEPALVGWLRRRAIHAASEPRLLALGRCIAAEQDAQLATSEQLATRAAMRAVAAHAAARSRTAAARPGVRRATLTLGAIATLALTICALAFVLHTRPLSVAVAGGAPVAVHELVRARDRVLTLRFSDRSEVELAPGARLRVLALTRREATLQLESGLARMHVKPGRSGEWTLQAGDFWLNVGTARFTLDYQAQDQVLDVRVLEGSVRVTGCTLPAGHTLHQGQTFRASCAGTKEHPTSPAPASPGVAPPTRALHAAPQPAAPHRAPPAVRHTRPAAQRARRDRGAAPALPTSVRERRNPFL